MSKALLRMLEGRPEGMSEKEIRSMLTLPRNIVEEAIRQLNGTLKIYRREGRYYFARPSDLDHMLDLQGPTPAPIPVPIKDALTAWDKARLVGWGKKVLRVLKSSHEGLTLEQVQEMPNILPKYAQVVLDLLQGEWKIYQEKGRYFYRWDPNTYDRDACKNLSVKIVNLLGRYPNGLTTRQILGKQHVPRSAVLEEINHLIAKRKVIRSEGRNYLA